MNATNWINYVPEFGEEDLPLVMPEGISLSAQEKKMLEAYLKEKFTQVQVDDGEYVISPNWRTARRYQSPDREVDGYVEQNAQRNEVEIIRLLGSKEKLAEIASEAGVIFDNRMVKSFKAIFL